MIYSSSITSNTVISRLVNTITSDCMVYNADPYVFNTSSITDANVRTSENIAYTYDAKLRQVCMHVLSSQQYTLSSCPRCLGTGYYYDIKIEESGDVPVVQHEDNLLQNLEKIVLTDNNPFHPLYAANLKKNLGQLQTNDLKATISSDIVNSLLAFKESQNTIANLSNHARISTLDSISVEVVDITSLKYTVTLTAVSGYRYNITGIIQL